MVAVGGGGSLEESSPEFCTAVFRQIEEVGWERLVRATDGLSSVLFRVEDESGRTHMLDIMLPPTYPSRCPSIAANVPYLPKIQWSAGSSRLKDVVCQFIEHLAGLQEFWSAMDDIDSHLPVINRKESDLAATERHIDLGDECTILLHIRPDKVSSLPECRFFGPDAKVSQLISKWRRNCKKWKSDKKFHENLAALLEILPAAPPRAAATDSSNEPADCGICYAQHLPPDEEEEESKSVDYRCENPSCSKSFHSICLREWLRSITTTRRSFDVLFGSCPYCSDPVAVKIY